MRHFSGTILFLMIGSTLGGHAFANSPKPSESDEFYKDLIESVGRAGGSPVIEDAATYNSGPITGIRVCHGSRLDSITVTYGKRIDGKKIGKGNGGKCEDLDLTGKKITAVRVRSGRVIDAIAFQIDGAWGESYGGGGGSEKTIRSPNRGSLAIIEGRHGSKVDQLTFTFGLPYTIKDIVYDQEAIASQTRLATIKNLGSQCFINQTPATQNASKSFKQDVTEKATWNFETSTQWGVEANFSYSYGGFSGGLTASFSQTQKKSSGSEKGESKSLANDYKTEVPPGTIIQTNFVASEKSIRIPFTYTMAHYRNDDPKDVVSEKQFSGVFDGLAYTDDRVEWKKVTKCDGSSAIDNLGSPQEQQTTSNSDTGLSQPPRPNTDMEPIEEQNSVWSEVDEFLDEEVTETELTYEEVTETEFTYEEVIETELTYEEVTETEVTYEEVTDE